MEEDRCETEVSEGVKGDSESGRDNGDQCGRRRTRTINQTSEIGGSGEGQVNI